MNDTKIDEIAQLLRVYAGRDIKQMEVPSERVQVEIAAADAIDQLCSQIVQLEDQLMKKMKMIANARGALGVRAWVDEP